MKTKGNDHAFQQTGVQPYKDGNKTVNVMSVTGGLTKREYFAAMAMQGFLSGPWGFQINTAEPKDKPKIAHHCVSMADALIKALNKEPEA